MKGWSVPTLNIVSWELLKILLPYVVYHNKLLNHSLLLRSTSQMGGAHLFSDIVLDIEGSLVRALLEACVVLCL